MQPAVRESLEKLGELSSLAGRLNALERRILGEMEDLLAEVLHRGIALRQIELAEVGLADENEDIGLVPPAVGYPLDDLLDDLRISQMSGRMLAHVHASSGACSRGLFRFA